MSFFQINYLFLIKLTLGGKYHSCCYSHIIFEIHEIFNPKLYKSITFLTSNKTYKLLDEYIEIFANV